MFTKTINFSRTKIRLTFAASALADQKLQQSINAEGNGGPHSS